MSILVIGGAGTIGKAFIKRYQGKFKFYNMSHITNEEFMKKEINVVVTGAAGQIGYSLIPRLIDGNLFKDTIVNLSLVEIPQVVEKLEGLAMELDDSYFPHLGSIDISPVILILGLIFLRNLVFEMFAPALF